MKRLLLLILTLNLAFACQQEKKTEQKTPPTAKQSSTATENAAANEPRTRIIQVPAEPKSIPPDTTRVTTLEPTIEQIAALFQAYLADKTPEQKQALLTELQTKYPKTVDKPDGDGDVEPPVKPLPYNPGIYTNPNRILANKALARSGDKIMQASFRDAIEVGKDQMKKPIRVITQTTMMIGTNDPHQLNSVGAYWHNVNGRWVNRDGHGNGLSAKIGDMEILQQGVGYVVPRLGLAYAASDNQAEKDLFAKRIVDYCTAFFLDPRTRMNPNLESANIIPESKDIRVEKAVEGELFVDVADGLMLIRDSKYYTPEFDRGMRQWYRDMFNWLTESRTGLAMQQKVIGNIGFIYESQLLAYSAFMGDTKFAHQRWPRIQDRLFHELASDNSMPTEARRAKPNMYYNKSYAAIIQCFRILAMQGVENVWNVERGGKSLKKGVLYLLPYMMKEKVMKRGEDVKPHYFEDIARTGQYVWRDDAKTVAALERYLSRYDPLRKRGGAKLISEPFLDWRNR